MELDPLLNFEHLSKATIVSMITGLSKPLDHNEPFELASDNERAEVEIDLQGNEFQIMFQQITNDERCNGYCEKKSFFSKLKANVELILRAVCSLNSMSPSSMELERVFSGFGCLHDDSVDMLTFLRGYFKTENN
jgi:hypothetical protein